MLNGSLWCGQPSTSRITAARSLSIRQHGFPSRKNRHALPVPNHWNVQAASFLPHRMKNLPLIVTFRKWRTIFINAFNLYWEKDDRWSWWSHFCVFGSSRACGNKSKSYNFLREVRVLCQPTHTYTHTYINIYIHTNKQTNIHTYYIHNTYIHTYVHTYIHNTNIYIYIYKHIWNRNLYCYKKWSYVCVL